ncbi:threonyl-tRNA synthetase, putative [Leishmania panamensis]|uniref:threonine--tRNA ligase n=3 Tax=Leishmania guyanensis species complex TaxID=38579 RepID=A0A088S0I4_LEIPA|nr:threonyl-tRNA synthetase, putative [Leishmania panamensis]AIO01754.1 threonyl-tRNA synthetase, putative [Leishmania panamensis]CCM18902.1 threonyl-tRNA synthetase, putative [Leishmania guyanensis]
MSGKKKATEVTVNLATLMEPDFWKQRVKIFEQLWQQQQNRYESMKAPIKVTLPDGKVMDAESWVTCPLDIAKCLSNSLPDKVIVARVNEALWDLTRPLEGDCHLELLDWDDEDAHEVFWHSSSHVLGYALERIFDTKLSVGPALKEGGFFYEGLTNRPVSESDYKAIESAMQELVKQKMPYQRLEVSKEDALRLFGYTEFKSKILASKVPDGGTCTVYRCGMLIDPCRGPHLPDTGRVKAFAVTKNSSSYFEGKAENEVLQRVYGISFPKNIMLTEWKMIQEEAAKRDHRVIGRQQNLFTFNEVSPGSAFWLPHGARIYNTLVEFLRKKYRRCGFQEVISPNMYSSKLWMVSGHWEKYADNMFCTKCEKEDFGLKPMNCPGHCIMFASQPHSYRELPIRYADFGVLHRNELSGALTGLTRVRRFQQDDAHIFCRMDQITDEMEGQMQFLSDVYGVLGFKFYFYHSTRPANKLGSDALWDQSESYLRAALNRFCGIPEELPDPLRPDQRFCYDGKPESVKKMKILMKKVEHSEDLNAWKGPTNGGEGWIENAGDGAFYGPKIDIVVEDALRRRHQCATIQLDFNLPSRFGLKYTLPAAEKEEVAAASMEKRKHTDPAPTTASPPAAADDESKPKLSTYEAAVRDLGIDLELDANQARPVMIHRAILGSLERSIAILCEHFGGDWPFWLSPRQVMVVPVSASNYGYAQKVRDTMHDAGFYADVDNGAATLDKKIRNSEKARYNFILVVGQQEQDATSVNIRARGERRLGNKSLAEVVQWFTEMADTHSRGF